MPTLSTGRRIQNAAHPEDLSEVSARSLSWLGAFLWGETETSTLITAQQVPVATDVPGIYLRVMSACVRVGRVVCVRL